MDGPLQCKGIWLFHVNSRAVNRTMGPESKLSFPPSQFPPIGRLMWLTVCLLISCGSLVLLQWPCYALCSVVTLELWIIVYKYQMSASHPFFFSHFLSLQVFRTDLITAMKLPDSYQLNPDEYYVLADPWRQEWEKGVQVPVSPGTIPEPGARYSLVQPPNPRKANVSPAPPFSHLVCVCWFWIYIEVQGFSFLIAHNPVDLNENFLGVYHYIRDVGISCSFSLGWFFWEKNGWKKCCFFCSYSSHPYRATHQLLLSTNRSLSHEAACWLFTNKQSGKWSSGLLLET